MIYLYKYYFTLLLSVKTLETLMMTEMNFNHRMLFLSAVYLPLLCPLHASMIHEAIEECINTVEVTRWGVRNPFYTTSTNVSVVSGVFSHNSAWDRRGTLRYKLICLTNRYAVITCQRHTRSSEHRLQHREHV
jgi:hypothetical protein